MSEQVKTVSIGFYRDDGDFQLLATLNNNDELVRDFDELVVSVILQIRLRLHVEEAIVALSRQDAPDYVDQSEEADLIQLIQLGETK
jgi:hypothetical protein